MPKHGDSPHEHYLRRRTVAACLSGAVVLGAAAGAYSVYRDHRPLPATAPAAAPTETVSAAPSSPPPPTAEQCASSFPLDFLAGQVLMVGVQGDSLQSQAAVFADYGIGGAIMMTAPASPLDGSIGRFKAAAASHGVQPLVSTDEEGGIVQRFASLGRLPAPQTVAATTSVSAAERAVAAHGRQLKAAGLDMVLGPLADVAPLNGTSPLGSRVFSSDPARVKSYAAAYVDGWRAAGLLPTLKHFPGMGSATGNTDYQSATTPPLSSLKSHDFLAYRGLAATGTAVMVGNQVVPGWSGGPANQSGTVVDYLRSQLGYKDNLLVTDALNAVAITNAKSIPQAVAGSLEAGMDMALLVPPAGTAATRQLAAGSEAALKAAVQQGELPKARLVAAVLHKLAAQHIAACSLAKEFK